MAQVSERHGQVGCYFGFPFTSHCTGHSDSLNLGINTRELWTTQVVAFKDIYSLETIPEGEFSESIGKEGPWCRIKHRVGKSVEFSLENEGMTVEELEAGGEEEEANGSGEVAFGGDGGGDCAVYDAALDDEDGRN